MDVVQVCSKLPCGLLLRTFSPLNKTVPVLGGGLREIVEYVADEERYALNKAIAPYASPLVDQFGNGIRVEQNFSVTEVPAAFWEKFYAQNKDAPYVKSGAVFAATKTNELRAMARDHRDSRTGLEPINPDGDPRNLKQRTKFKAGAVVGIDTAQPGE